MPGTFEQFIVGWAEGKGKNLAKSKNRSEAWASLKKILRKPYVTPETRREFDKMSKEEQDKLKAINGWISGAQCKDNHRSLKNVMPRNLLTIDIDYAPDTILDDIEIGLTRISHFEAAWHSSRRHTPEEPRVRLFMPMKRKVTVDEYTAIVRFVGWMLDPTMKLVDQVSYRPAQMMFKPSCSRTDEKDFFFNEQHGKLLDPDEMLAAYVEQFGDWTDLSVMPKHPDEELRKRADKAEDPRTKKGMVGAFCRTYDIFSAMEKFLPGVYLEGETHAGGAPRYTYAGSTSSNGAVVYDDGLFLYSHHGHDPCCDMNVNAFDLVRIHLYGDADEKAKEDTSPSDMPSYGKMKELLAGDASYNETRVSEKFDLGNMFDGAFDDGEDHGDNFQSDDDEGSADTDGDGEAPEQSDDNGDDDEDDVVGRAGDAHHSDRGSADTDDRPDDDEPDSEPGQADGQGTGTGGAGPDGGRGTAAGSKKSSGQQKQQRPSPSQKRAPRKDWFKEELEFTENAEVKATLHNIATIIQNDPRLLNVIWYNEFDKNVVLRKDIKPRVNVAPVYSCRNPSSGDRWQDFHDITIRAILESPHGEGKAGYGMRVTDRDLISGITLAARMTPFHPIRDYLLTVKWDGKKRIDSYLTRYLEVPDNVYHQQVGAVTLIASVARIFEPGHKFDYAPILEGLTGIGKSWFIKAIYGAEWFGELAAKLDEPQKIAEQITGKWGVELPELSGFHKSDHNSAKAFMRRQTDDVRMAYDRRVTEFPRQCVCWGTTNDKKYLKDPTGNRSYWPVVVPRTRFIDLAAVEAERDQLWAEAVERYFAMRAEKPTGELPLMLIGQEAQSIAKRLQEEARTEELHEIWHNAILDWLDEPVTLHALKQEFGVNDDQMFNDDGTGDQEVWVRRTVFTQKQAMVFAINKQHGVVTDHTSTQTIAKALGMLEGWSTPKTDYKGTAARRVMGQLGRWWQREGATAEDRVRGYEVVPQPGTEDDDMDCI